MSAKRAYFDQLRVLDFSLISTSYQPIGQAFAVSPRIICITNNTLGDVLVSDDGSTDQLFIASKSFKLFDLTANLIPGKDDGFTFAEGTILYIKQSTAPVSGSVYVEILYAQ